MVPDLSGSQLAAASRASPNEPGETYWHLGFIRWVGPPRTSFATEGWFLHQ
jgi:hypothetical protein